MKHIKNRILITVCSSIAVMAVLFLVAFNIFINSYFEGEARKAIHKDINFMSEDWENDKINIFDSYLRYHYLTEEKDPEWDTFPTYQEGKELYNYFLENGMDKDEEYSLETDDKRYVFAVHSYTYDNYILDEDIDFENIDYDTLDTETVTETYVVYVDILPFMSFASGLNWIFVAILVVVTAIMSIVGLNLGRRIENVQNNQNKFFQNASHELKTPLMSIQGYAEAIQEDIMDHGKAADIIMEESERMSTLVEEILAISKIDSGQLKLNLAPVDIREILYDCLQSQQIIMDKKGIKALIDFSSEKVQVMADDVQLRKAFMNILANDIRYCNERLLISCKVQKGDVKVLFEDDGPGLSPEMKDKVFARFHTGPKGQTGIGLALTKEIVQLHKGRITAYNGSEKGTVFEIHLPQA